MIYRERRALSSRANANTSCSSNDRLDRSVHSVFPLTVQYDESLAFISPNKNKNNSRNCSVDKKYYCSSVLYAFSLVLIFTVIEKKKITMFKED